MIKKVKVKSKNKKIEKDPLTLQNEKNDYLACISRLREQLKIANEDRRTLITELRKRQMYNSNNSNNINYNNSMNNFNNKISSELENATIKLDTNQKILQLKQKELENYIERYEKEREKVRKLQNELKYHNIKL